MKFSIVLVALTAGTSIAHPGMSKAMADIQEIQARDGRSGPSTEMIGDLVDLDDRRLTATGRDIKNILSGRGIPQNTVASYWLGAPRLGGLLCRMDQCCVWKHIANEMRGMMVGDAGRCNNLARTSIRLGFHDAATWSKDTGGTGADGSIVLTAKCARVPENNGLAEPPCRARLGPRIKTYIGRKDNAVEPPRNLLPSPFHSADRLLQLFADKTFTADGLIALMGAHSTSQQRFVNRTRPGDPKDSTPGVWDVKYYGETIDANAPQRVFKFQSDVNLANDARTRAAWESFIPESSQGAWNHAYAAEYVRMSLLGVYNINSLTDCTKALPPFQRSYSSSDKSVIDRFMHGLIGSAQKVKNLLLKGDKVPSNV
ncbi:hypothetical protein VD0002_g1292 [Verticillium dahliae]|uniref:Peroxidase n=1 Tax=Verticillium dahliae TaxID=27337 RepID=A0AA45ANG3_VERDA|nr:DNA damage-inducible protein 1 [Verticillium dahliae VDG2]PNH33278.1 hypothetical protein BJF96_g3598 [Verticillium dahliae]PNH54888.1 hypothetical protein VD0003_g2666 [Verticillium dahliae]PNH68894.1 hypothetical protein VD0002_g1292 [Verticillium dahliae]